MNQPMTQIPMTTMPQKSAYPTMEDMTTNTANQGTTIEQIADNSNNDPSEPSLLRLRGGGCIKDCLAAIGCCCLCEACCC